MNRIYEKTPQVLLSALFFFCIAVIGCAKNTASSGAGGAQKDAPVVTATIFPPYDFARAIAGDKARLSMLIPPAAESHSFEPTPKDIIAIQNSDIFIYIGGESDAWVDRILESMDTSGMKILSLMNFVDAVEEETVEGMEDDADEEEAAYDEHIWTSPKNAVRMAGAIADALCEVDEKNASFYRANAKNYTERLLGLDAAFRSVVDGAKRKTLVFADRFPFRYFADEYGLSYFAAFPGCSTETEPSAATVAFLIDKVKNERIPVVFHIELSNEKMADTIAEATGAKKSLFHSAHNISKKDFENGVTYLDLQGANVERLREALE